MARLGQLEVFVRAEIDVLRDGALDVLRLVGDARSEDVDERLLEDWHEQVVVDEVACTSSSSFWRSCGSVEESYFFIRSSISRTQMPEKAPGRRRSRGSAPPRRPGRRTGGMMNPVRRFGPGASRS